MSAEGSKSDSSEYTLQDREEEPMDGDSDEEGDSDCDGIPEPDE